MKSNKLCILNLYSFQKVNVLPAAMDLDRSLWDWYKYSFNSYIFKPNYINCAYSVSGIFCFLSRAKSSEIEISLSLTLFSWRYTSLFYFHDVHWYRLLKRNNMQKLMNSNFFLCFADINFHEQMKAWKPKNSNIEIMLIYLNILTIKTRLIHFKNIKCL